MSLTDWNPAELATAIADPSPLLVELGAAWCPNCRVQAGMLERMIPEFEGRLRIGRHDHGTYPEIGDANGIRSLPAVLLYRDGKIQQIIQGFKPAAALRNSLETFLAQSNATSS